MLDFQQHLEGSPFPHLLCTWPHPWGLSAQSDGSWEGWLLDVHAHGWSSMLVIIKASPTRPCWSKEEVRFSGGNIGSLPLETS